jgi:hypothetical protein
MDTLYYFWPERGRMTTMLEDQLVWAGYGTAAAAAELRLDVITADDVEIVTRSSGAIVFVRGEPVDPAAAVFHNKLYTWPAFAPDCWRYLSTFQAIEGAGYCTLIPGELNLILNDKGSTLTYLRAADAGWLATLTVPTRDFTGLVVALADAGIAFPVVVKPASWGAGMGVSRAADEAQLLMALRLASAAELTMVIQPDLGQAADFADVRVYCANRRPVAALRRVPTDRGGVANVTNGGSAEIIGVPGPLADRARTIAEFLDLPWLGVDFLRHEGRYYLCEVEADACISARTLELPGAAAVLRERFLACRSDFGAWLAARPVAGASAGAGAGAAGRQDRYAGR